MELTYAILEHSSVVELPAYIRRVPGSIPGVPILGKRQRLAVLQRTVNPFPRGKHWRFNSSLPHFTQLPKNTVWQVRGRQL